MIADDMDRNIGAAGNAARRLSGALSMEATGVATGMVGAGGGGGHITLNVQMPNSMLPASPRQMREAAAAFGPELVRYLRSQGVSVGGNS